MKFDICDFYPAITDELLLKSIDFVRQFVEISDNDLNIIMHSRKCLLCSSQEQWVKKDGNELFDVTMESFAGAEVCELVGLYLSSKIADVMAAMDPLDRNDGLAEIRCTSGCVLDRIRKDGTEVFF